MPPSPGANGRPPADDKESWRRHCAAAGSWSPAKGGRLAQHLRALEAYRRAAEVFVSPSPLLKQVRINALVDGKFLLMPAPGLHQGFYLFSPFTIPFSRLPSAVTPKGMLRHGKRLATGELARLRLGLLVTEALAVDRRGYLLGDGNGFFDLAAAILATTGALAAGAAVVAAAPEVVAPITPATPAAWTPEPWDVPADYRLDTTGIVPCRPNEDAEAAADWPIYWQNLPLVRLRRITPLWQLREAG